VLGLDPGIQGISTRSVDDLVKAMGMSGISKHALAAATTCVSPARLRSMYRLTWRSVIRCPGISLPPAIAGG
jgi:hypothetical protein